ncbi:hypothetical protein WHR41_03449 [Cladosporium halotolerans]|uniref:Peptidase S9 prolyl oligopeptidase catalytic domain-containing protein n=1 Tax=Cladosporium halotolerans TaxID=1052096 RepID=A0AB34KV35_9PEZI
MHLVLRYALQYARAAQACLGLSPPPSSRAPPEFTTLAFSEEWQILGPFQIGTREAIWGADPLEQHGGFRAFERDRDSHFPSSLPANASVFWSNATAKLGDPSTNSASVELTVQYPDVDWAFLQQVYGWAALQWQAWARGEIIVERESTIALALDVENVLEYWIDGVHYFGGDFYGYGKAAAVLHLEPGIHRIDVRLVRDVRSMGGITTNPAINVRIDLQASRGDVQAVGNIVIADRIDGANDVLASDLASAMIRNNLQEKVVIRSAQPQDSMRNICEVRLALQASIEIAPGGMVSYAILRPPSLKAIETCNSPDGKLPILLALHGAGLEADSDQVRHGLDPLPDLCAWVLFPTGVTPWSGDDWHNWGYTDVEAAISAILKWIEQHSWEGPGVDIDRWLVSGHSNGGQGTWYFLTHHPDKVFAAAPLSGYSSIQNYVPYEFWRTADARKASIVQASLSDYRHELLLENAKGIPILQQHGSADDNVPAYHSRLMHQLLDQSDAHSTYFEMEGKPHYWDGVMTTPHLAEFFQAQLNASEKKRGGSSKSSNFTIVSADPGDTGSKNGVKILGLITPGQLGRVDFTLQSQGTTCSLFTSNVRSLQLSEGLKSCKTLFVDDKRVNSGLTGGFGDLVLERRRDGTWISKTVRDDSRRGRQSGAIDAVLRTRSTIQILSSPSEDHEGVKHTALQISRNLCQYFSADTEMASNASHAINDSTGNVISVSVGEDVQHRFGQAAAVKQAISLHKDRIELKDAQGTTHTYPSRSKGLAAIFLRPLPNERLELVVWGVDKQSLSIAARLVPTLTGAGVPDFVVANSDMLWKGVEGTLAMGFFDDLWNVSSNAFS